MEDLLRGNNAEIPPLPDLMLENNLLLSLVVPKPLIRNYVATFMAELPLDHRYDPQTRYDCALHIGLVGMIAGALVVDNLGTELVSMIPG